MCTSCGKTKVAQKARNSGMPKSNANRRLSSSSNHGSPYGNPKVRMSFSARNR